VLLVGDGNSTRCKIGAGHVYEYDVRALAPGARFFHEHLRYSLGDFALLIDRAPLEPSDVYIWHFGILLKIPDHESSAKIWAGKLRLELKCVPSLARCLC